MTFTVTETSDRISAVDRAGVEICGAFQPDGHSHWQVFVHRCTGLRIPPSRRHFIGDHARTASLAWVHSIARHYTKGLQP